MPEAGSERIDRSTIQVAHRDVRSFASPAAGCPSTRAISISRSGPVLLSTRAWRLKVRLSMSAPSWAVGIGVIAGPGSSESQGTRKIVFPGADQRRGPGTSSGVEGSVTGLLIGVRGEQIQPVAPYTQIAALAAASRIVVGGPLGIPEHEPQSLGPASHPFVQHVPRQLRHVRLPIAGIEDGIALLRQLRHRSAIPGRPRDRRLNCCYPASRRIPRPLAGRERTSFGPIDQKR